MTHGARSNNQSSQAAIVQVSSQWPGFYCCLCFGTSQAFSVFPSDKPQFKFFLPTTLEVYMVYKIPLEIT